MNTNINHIECAIENIINKLHKFSKAVVEIRPPICKNAIANFERRYNTMLPYDYKYLLSKTNGFTLFGDEIYGINDNISSLKEDLFSVYEFEHHETYKPQYEHIIPFSPDGRGNFYCFDTKSMSNNNLECNIVFWQSNYEYSEFDQPEITHLSLVDYINECIFAWNLEIFDYNGDAL